MSSIDEAIRAAEREAEVAGQRPADGHDPISGAELLPREKFLDSRMSLETERAREEELALRRRALNVYTLKKEHSELKEAPPFFVGTWRMFTATKVNLMLVFLPLGICAELLEWSDGSIFALNCLAILPLAKLLGDATEQVALHTNDTIGGLLNATFGNATELIVSVFALVKGLLGVVQVSLLGSIISNTLLVLGMACIAGGITKPVQKFNSTAASANTTLLLMSILGMCIPAALASLGEIKVMSGADLLMSRMTAIILLFLYCLYIYFQLVTHRKYFEAEPDDDKGPALTGTPGSFNQNHNVHVSRASSLSIVVTTDEEEEEVYFTIRGALFWLGGITILIAFLSEFLTGAIEGGR
jgi:Ca2+:H+ antiporter